MLHISDESGCKCCIMLLHTLQAGLEMLDGVHLQEDFLAAVWDRDAGGVPPPTEAAYNMPEAVPAFQQQPTVGLHPDYRQARMEQLPLMISVTL